MRTGITMIVIVLLLGLGRNAGLAADSGRLRPDDYIESIPTTPYGAALQPDGKIVLAGTAGNHFALARFNADGSLDLNFDGDGKVDTSFGVIAVGYDMALQPDGKILVAGKAGTGFALARYNPDGSLDSAFDGDGKVTTAFGADAAGSAVGLQADGKIVLAGTAGSDFAVARYNPDGSLDPGFGGSGKVTTSFTESAAGSGVVLLPGGKIVVAGMAGRYFALARYMSDGSPDPAFGADGKLVTGFQVEPGYGLAIALQPDEKIVAIGSTGYFYGSTFALARFNPDGSLDTGFGENGVTYPYIADEYAWGYAVAVRPDNKIVAAGTGGIFCQCDFPPLDFGVTRLNPDGSHDYTYSGGTIEISGTNDRVYAIVLQPDDKLVLAGPAGDSFYGDVIPDFFALARFTPGGGLDSSFSDDGKVMIGFSIIVPYYLPVVQR